MTLMPARERALPTLRVRTPGSVAIRECLDVQESRHLSILGRIAGSDPLSAKAAPAYDAALAQLAVARHLTGLGPGWSVIHSIPLDERDAGLDHLVVGPPGVFVLTTRSYPNASLELSGHSFLVNGESGVSMPGMQTLARRTSEFLSLAARRYVPVTAVVVVVGAASIATGRLSPVVPVLPAERIRPWLLSQHRAMADSAVADLVRFAEEPATWDFDTDELADASRQEQRFARLRRDVASSAARRRGWAVTAIVLALAVITGVALETAGVLTLALAR